MQYYQEKVYIDKIQVLYYNNFTVDMELDIIFAIDNYLRSLLISKLYVFFVLLKL